MIRRWPKMSALPEEVRTLLTFGNSSNEQQQDQSLTQLGSRDWPGLVTSLLRLIADNSTDEQTVSRAGFLLSRLMRITERNRRQSLPEPARQQLTEALFALGVSPSPALRAERARAVGEAAAVLCSCLPSGELAGAVGRIVETLMLGSSGESKERIAVTHFAMDALTYSVERVSELPSELSYRLFTGAVSLLRTRPQCCCATRAAAVIERLWKHGADLQAAVLEREDERDGLVRVLLQVAACDSWKCVFCAC